jgi:hypothetical protein
MMPGVCQWEFKKTVAKLLPRLSKDSTMRFDEAFHGSHLFLSAGRILTVQTAGHCPTVFFFPAS